MKSILAHRRYLMMALLAAVAVTAVSLLAQTPENLLTEARQQYEEHNYATSLELADKGLGGEPQGDTLIGLQRLKALSMCKLDGKNGYEYAKQIMESHEPFKTDAELWFAMGDDRFDKRENVFGTNQRLAYRCYLTAAELARADEASHELAAVSYFRVMECLDTDSDATPVQQELNSSEKREAWAADEILRIGDLIETLKVPDETKAKALYEAGQKSSSQISVWFYALKAIERYKRVIEKYPETAYAVRSQYEIGGDLENYGRFLEAIDAYTAVIKNYHDEDFAEDATCSIEHIKRPQISIYSIEPYLPGAKAVLYWKSRNIKKVHLKAYQVDLYEEFSKATPEELSGYRYMEMVLGPRLSEQAKAVAEWDFDIPDQGDHKYHICDAIDDEDENEDDEEEGETRSEEAASPIVLPFSDAGTYVIEASGSDPDGEDDTSYCLVVFTQITAVAKLEPMSAMVYVADAVTGKPVADADVFACRSWSVFRDAGDDKKYYEYFSDNQSGKTADNGLVNLKFSRSDDCEWYTVVRHGRDQALCGADNFRSYWYSRDGRTDYKLYGFTERPVYRPGQTVHFKQILRSKVNGEYVNLPDTTVTVEIEDPQDQIVYSKELVTNSNGTVEGQFTVMDDAPLGGYYIKVLIEAENEDGKLEDKHLRSSGNYFRVEEYKKPEYKVTVTPAESSYLLGDDVKIKIAANYYHGQPVADARVKFNVWKKAYRHQGGWDRPWGWIYESVETDQDYSWDNYSTVEYVTRGEIKTDSNGEAFVTVKADPVEYYEKCDIDLTVVAEVTDASRRVVSGRGTVQVAHVPLYIYPKADRNIYGPSDSVEVNIKTENSAGSPVAGDFTVEVWTVEHELVNDGYYGQEVFERMLDEGSSINTYVKYKDRLVEKLHSEDIRIPGTGRATVHFKPGVTGRVKVIVRQKSGNQEAASRSVDGWCYLWVVSETENCRHYSGCDLAIVPASDQFEIGEKMKVLICTKKPGRYVLLTGETDIVLFSQVVHVEKTSRLIELPVMRNLCPNFKLVATMLQDECMYAVEKDIIVPPTDRFIKVELALDKGSMGGGDKNTFAPRESTNVRVKLTDVHTGKPVVGEVALFMVDASLYYIHPEYRSAIERDFYDNTRRHDVKTFDCRDAVRKINHYFTGGYSVGYSSGMSFLRARPDNTGGGFFSECESSEGGQSLEGDIFVEPVVRQFFRDTVLWAGTVTTDADGLASVPVTLPDQMTTFALHAIAVDADTRVGEATSDVISTKHIICRLEGGRFFTEGDQSYVTVIAHNYFDRTEKLVIDLAADDALEIRKVRYEGSWCDYKAGSPLEVSVPVGGEVRLDFQTAALRPGDVKITARARGTRESDAIQLIKPIVPWGAQKLVTSSGVLKGGETQSVSVEIDVPEKIAHDSQSLTITLEPSVAAVAIESLPFLADYPYGCAEQTMSRFLPTILMRKTMLDAGINLDDVRKLVEQQSASDPKLAVRWKNICEYMGRNPVYDNAEVDRMIAAALKRLVDMQHGDGGWGWWKDDDSTSYMTAYVVNGLSLARDCDVQLSDEMLERGSNWLVERLSKPKVEDSQSWWRRHDDNDNVRAFMLYAVSQADAGLLEDEKLQAELKRLMVARDGLSDQGRAMLAIAMYAAGLVEDAETIIGNFENTAKTDEKASVVYWGSRRDWWYWYEGDVETTSWVLQAMLTVSPEDKRVPMAVRYLIENRRGVHWGNTRSTALAVFALARYAKDSGELDCDQTYEILFDDAASSTVQVKRENMFSFDSRIVIPSDQLAPGRHKVEIRRKGKGSLYWGTHLKYFTKEDILKGGGNQLALDRKYFRLVPEEFENTRRVWRGDKAVEEKFRDIRYKAEPLEFGAEIASGELIEVRITIDSERNLEYVMFEDAKPAGCEPHQLTSGESYGGGVYANMELRDTKVVFFATWLDRGRHELAYRLVCEQPGTFRVLPTSGEAMYTPFIEAISDSGKLDITPGGN